jgi:hypothetical protein
MKTILPQIDIRLSRFARLTDEEFPINREGILGVLNGPRDELSDYFRMLIERWKSSGPNLEQMMIDTGLNSEIAESWIVGFSPTIGARMCCEVFPGWKVGVQPNAERHARFLFLGFVIFPDCEKLAGPCARCGNYYFKKRSDNKTYCSTSCGTNMTSRDKKRKDREEIERRRLAEVRSVAAKELPSIDWARPEHRMKLVEVFNRRKTPRSAPLKAQWLTRKRNEGKL